MTIASYGRATNRSIYNKRASWQSDPSKSDNLIYKKVREHLPPDTKITKVNSYASKTDVYKAHMPKSDPRYDMADAIKRDYNKAMEDPRFSREDPEAIIDTLYKAHLNKRREDVHKYSWDNRNSPWRVLPGASKSIRELPDQAKWDVAKPRDEYGSVVTNFLLGAGGAVVFGGGLALAGLAAPITAAGVATAGALAIPGFLAFDKVVNEIESTEWAEENPGSANVAKFVLGGLAGYGIESAISKGIFKGLAKYGSIELAEAVAEKAVVAKPTGENLLNLANIQGKQKDLLSVLTNRIKKEAPKIMEAAVKADETIAKQAVKRASYKDTQIVNKRANNFLEDATGRLGGVDPEATVVKNGVAYINKKPVISSDITIEGTRHTVKTSDIVTGETLKKNKKFKVKKVKLFEKVVDKVEKEGISYQQATKEVNINEALKKDMNKNINVIQAASDGNAKVANKARENVTDIQQAHGITKTPVKTKAKVKAEKKAKKVVDKAIVPKTEKVTSLITTPVNKELKGALKELKTLEGKNKVTTAPKNILFGNKLYHVTDAEGLTPKSLDIAKSGKNYGGYHDNLDGIYLTLGKKDMSYGKNVVEASIGKDAKVIKYTDLTKEYNKIKAKTKLSLKEYAKENYDAATFHKQNGDVFEVVVLNNGVLKNPSAKLVTTKGTEEFTTAPISDMSKIDAIADIPNYKADPKGFEAWVKEQTPRDRIDIMDNYPLTSKERSVFDKVSKEYAQGVRTKIAKYEGDDIAETTSKFVQEVAENPSGVIDDLVDIEKEMSDSGIDMLNKDVLRKLIPVLTLATSIVPILTLLDASSPDEASAGVASQGVKWVSNGITKAAIKAAEKEKATVLAKSLRELNYIIPDLIPNQTFPSEVMKSPTIIPNIKDIATLEPFNPVGQMVASTHTVFEHFFVNPTAKTADRITNPMIQVVMQDTVVKNMIKNNLIVTSNIMKDAGIEDASKIVSKAMKPVLELHDKAIERSAHRFYVRKYETSLKREYKALDKITKSSEIEAKTDALSIMEDNLSKHKQLVEDLNPLYEEYLSKWDAIIKPLAEVHPSVRVFLASEDLIGFKKYPWLQNLMKENELTAVSKLKILQEDYAFRMIELKQKVLTDYPHMYHASHPSSDYNRLQKEMEKGFGTGYQITPPMAKFFQRDAKLMPIMPETHYSMQRYIPDAESRLASIAFWKGPEGTGKGGWKAFMNNPVVKGNDSLRKAFEGLEDSFKPRDKSGTAIWANRAYAFEVARLLAGSTSVPFKHSMKAIGDLRVFGVEGLKTMPEASGIWKRNQFRKAGINVDRKFYDSQVEQWTNTGNMIQTISDMEVGRFPEKAWDAGMQKFNAIGGYPTTMVENFDRTLSVLASMKMAAKQGMSPDQAMYATFDTILRTNFLSGKANPAWLRNPYVRFFFMFQGTPFKLLEQKVLTATGTYRSGKKAVNVLMEQLRADVKEGEKRLKWGVIKEALNSEKDVFGTSISKQFMRQALTMGAVIGGAKQVVDGDLTDHFFHIGPFDLKPNYPIPKTSPIPTAAYRTVMSDDDEFWLSKFFGEWFSRKGPLPIALLKAARLVKGDIPARYSGSELKYVLGVPSHKAKKNSNY